MSFRLRVSATAFLFFGIAPVFAGERCVGRLQVASTDYGVTVDIGDRPRPNGALDIAHAQVVPHPTGKDDHLYSILATAIDGGRHADINGVMYKQYNIILGQLGDRVLSVPADQDGKITAFLGQGADVTQLKLECDTHSVAAETLAHPPTHQHGGGHQH